MCSRFAAWKCSFDSAYVEGLHVHESCIRLLHSLKFSWPFVLTSGTSSCERIRSQLYFLLLYSYIFIVEFNLPFTSGDVAETQDKDLLSATDEVSGGVLEGGSFHA
jgi:hypothetical protein